jgi:hypothetical protein
MISYDYNLRVKIRIFIEFVESNNEWEFVEDNDVYVHDLPHQLNEYIVAYKRVHYQLHHIVFDTNKCSVYLVEF